MAKGYIRIRNELLPESRSVSEYLGKCEKKKNIRRKEKVTSKRRTFGKIKPKKFEQQ